jgi:hypothetical protein
VVFPHDLYDHDHSGQGGTALKKKIYENITSIPTPDSTNSTKQKKVEMAAEGVGAINLDSP